MLERHEETERRLPRPAVLTLDEVLACFEKARDEHILGSPSTRQDLDALERTLDAVLPDAFRTFLLRLGGGLFFRGHEIFGPRRVLVHDIELVPDILSMRRNLNAQGVTPPPHAIPIHRARGVVHYMRLGHGAGAGEIVTAAQAAAIPDLASFLESIVMPRLSRAAS